MSNEQTHPLEIRSEVDRIMDGETSRRFFHPV
jgi:hypothetical protein